MEKRFKVGAVGETMDAECTCRDKDQAIEVFEIFRDSGSYKNVHIIDIDTDEVYRRYDIYPYNGGVKVEQWEKLEW